MFKFLFFLWLRPAMIIGAACAEAYSAAKDETKQGDLLAYAGAWKYYAACMVR